ncbi:S41 family peptidase, partial [Pseudophaeobacter arcticus]|uniref:S41 family peptidase n=1 Tax=Pseudophaeobacter arcticus TaxID=385492 RepID=UPI00249251F1
GNVRDTILQGQGTVAGNEFVQYGLARPDVGYIALISVAGYSHGKEDYLFEDIEEIETILDTALVEFAQAGVTAVIVDLSLNFGGYDEAALVIASRFAAAPVVAFSEYPADAQNPAVVQRRVMPSQRPSYTGPLYLVTSNMTVSAAEILTMALRALPQTVHVGSPTRGALSDVLEKELPNGWQVNLSNEVYADHEGILWEGRGIAPYLSIDVFGGSDPLQSHRRAIAIVLAQIRSDRR